MDRPVDAFILYNSNESAIVTVVQELEKRGVKAFFSPRDIAPGEAWQEIEDRQLKDARTVVVFLGAAGWGPQHLPLTERADRMNKRIIPVLVSDPPVGALDAAGALFRTLQYVDLRQPNSAEIVRLVNSILSESGERPTGARDINQEVRFAVVLYGGVSLAIYINGVVQELRNLVRSTSGDPLAAEEESGPVGVYRRLACMLEREKIPTQLLPKDAPVRTRFRVDVISGTSAGGINGIFLAKSLANNVPMTSLQDLWFDEGAIDNLLNDKRSYKDARLNEPREKESLLNSRRMYLKLLNALDSMDPGNRVAVSRDGAVSPLADEIDLFTTTTDIEGVPVPIQLFDNVVFERRFRNSYHLRFEGGERNDFQPDNNPFLAFAARCTSSFPFAFEPMQLCSIDEIVQRSSIYAAKPYCFSNSTRWQKYYTNYLGGVLPGSTSFPKRAFGDGGYLNNAPFSFAVDALLQRQSDLPLDRKLIYVEPSPAHPEEEPVQQEPPNAIENSVDALITIPGYQTIRNDLVRVLDRNRMVTKINKTLAEVEQEIENQAKALRKWQEETREIQFSEDPCLVGYYRMRAAEITDLIARMIARLRFIDEDSAYFLALRSLIRAWRERQYAVDPRTSWQAGKRLGKAETGGLIEFLEGFDLPYRVRRLRFMARKLDGLYGLRFDAENPAHADALATLRFGLENPNPSSELPNGLREVRARVGQQQRRLKQVLEALLAVPEPTDSDTPRDQSARAGRHGVAFVGATLPSREQILQVLDQILQIKGEAAAPYTSTGKKRALYATEATVRKSTEPRDLEVLCDLRARDLLAGENNELANILTELGNALRDRLKQTLDQVHENISGAFQDGTAGRVGRRLYLYFDLFDGVQFPMMFGTDVLTSDTVEILRIAPEDAGRLVPEVPERRRKLKGLAVAHFGAFLDRDWRVSDLLWGRLDAAERLISALLPWQESVEIRMKLIDEAHSAIFEDFQTQRKLKDMAARQVVAQGPENRLSDEAVQRLINVVTPATDPPSLARHQELMDTWQDVVPKEMNRRSQVETLARSTTIIGKMLETISAKRSLPVKASWLTNAGRAFWGVVEISVPRSAFQLLGTYWQSLLFLIAVILIVAGLFASKTGVSGVGWSLFAVAVLLFVLRTILGSYMRGGKALRAIVGIVVVLLTALLAVGAWQTYRWLSAYISFEAVTG